MGGWRPTRAVRPGSITKMSPGNPCVASLGRCVRWEFAGTAMRTPYCSPSASRLCSHSSEPSRLATTTSVSIERDGVGVRVQPAEVLEPGDRHFGRAALVAEVEPALVGRERSGSARLGEIHQLLDRQHPDAVNPVGPEPGRGGRVRRDVVLHAHLLQRPMHGIHGLGHRVAERSPSTEPPPWPAEARARDRWRAPRRRGWRGAAPPGCPRGRPGRRGRPGAAPTQTSPAQPPALR